VLKSDLRAKEEVINISFLFAFATTAPVGHGLHIREVS
jgi:hypothetical protein